MLTDKQIEREEAFFYDWYMVRKMGKTPTFADAIAWVDKTMIEKSISWFYKNVHKEKYWDDKGYLLIVTLIEDYRKAMEE